MSGETESAPGDRERGRGGSARPAPVLDSTVLPARHMTAQQMVYDILRRRILRGSLPPGTRLLQADIASQLSLSTTPVREALQRLSTEGLVRIDAHRGALVRGLNIEELTEVYELRMVLEPLAIRKAVLLITDSELARAEDLCAKMDELDDAAAWAEANRDFHAILAEAARSPYLNEILESLRDKAMPYVRLSMGLRETFHGGANAEHRQLLHACRDRDPEHAARIELRHLASTRDLTMNAARAGLGQEKDGAGT